MVQIWAILKEVPSRCANSGLAITRRDLERHVMLLYQNISNALKGQDKSEFEVEGSVGTEVGDSSALYLPLFTENQRTLVVELIRAERRHATRCWTHLSEMRRRKELPEWVAADIAQSLMSNSKEELSVVPVIE